MNYERLAGPSAAGITAMPAESSQPPIAAAMDNLGRNVLRLLEGLGHLESRLSVVAPPRPENVANKSPEPPPTNTLARLIDNDANRVALACSRVESILSRLEL